jgi:hypothetical protein
MKGKCPLSSYMPLAAGSPLQLYENLSAGPSASESSSYDFPVPIFPMQTIPTRLTNTSRGLPKAGPQKSKGSAPNNLREG